MRIPSGKTDQKIAFVAVDATDLKTRETGLSSFTVYRSRNGATPVAYTTPTVAELSGSNMPGVYVLTVDEDTTIASSSDSEEYIVHITATGMAPVTRTIEIYRRDTTSGCTLAITTGGALGTGVITSATFATSAINQAAIAADAITNSELAASAVTEIVDAVWANTSRTLSAGTNIVLAKGVGITGFNDLDAVGVRTALGLASANLDTQMSGLATAANLATLAGYVDTEVAAIKAKTDNLPSDPADQSLIITATNTIRSDIAALNNISTAQVNAEVVDVLTVDTFAEPGQGAPPATATLAVKLGYLFKAFRNRKTQTADTFSLYADDGVTIDQKSAVSDDGTTATRGELVGGP